MEGLLDWLLNHGSYAVFLGVLLLAGLGMPVPEDAVLLAAGVLSRDGAVELNKAAATCVVGVLTGDTLLFFIARRIGPSVLSRRPFRWWLTRQRRVQIEELFERKGGWVIFGARHVAGLRAPIFATAASHGMPFSRFLFWDALGLAISGPIIMGLGYFFAENIQSVFGDFRKLENIIFLFAVLAGGGFLLFYLRSRAVRSESNAEEPKR